MLNLCSRSPRPRFAGVPSARPLAAAPAGVAFLIGGAAGMPADRPHGAPTPSSALAPRKGRSPKSSSWGARRKRQHNVLGRAPSPLPQEPGCGHRRMPAGREPRRAGQFSPHRCSRQANAQHRDALAGRCGSRGRGGADTTSDRAPRPVHRPVVLRGQPRASYWPSRAVTPTGGRGVRGWTSSLPWR